MKHVGQGFQKGSAGSFRHPWVSEHVHAHCWACRQCLAAAAAGPLPPNRSALRTRTHSPPLAPPLSASMITLVFYHRVCCAFKGHIGAVGIHQQTHPMHEHRVINRRTQITRSLQLKPIVRTVVYLCFRSSARPTRLGVLYYWGFVSFLPEARTFPCCIVAPWCTCCLNSAQPNDLCV